MGQKVIKYDVVYGCDRAAFYNIVNQRTSEGWQPLGGIAVAYDALGNLLMAQAMVKYA